METLDRPPQAEVTVYSPLGAPETKPLPSASVSIGRASECTIPIRDRYLSRKHAEIVPVGASWMLKDCGSANGTFVNGVRVEAQKVLRSGDRIRLGDSEIIFRSGVSSDSGIALGEAPVSATISIPYRDIVDTQPGATVDQERLRVLNALAVELIEDRPLDSLFGFIVDRLLDHLEPSRVAIGVLDEDGTNFRSIELRKKDPTDDADLTISRTLVREVVEEKKVLSFVDTSADEKLASAKSIVMQGIRSAIVAPLILGDTVAGMLYLDYRQTRPISDEDVHLVGQIARLASMKLETTHLREEAMEMRLLEEELRTAATIQQRLLPGDPPEIAGFTLAGSNRPCRTVSGDYYDFVARPDGHVWFVIGDVAGKGVTAALIMASLQSAFRIFVKENPAPEVLVTKLNDALRESIPSTRFVTLIAGRLDTASGRVELTNAGHPHPIHLTNGGTEPFGKTDLLLGLFPNARYSTQSLTLGPGDSLVLFTDGAMECSSEDGEELGMSGIRAAVEAAWGRPAAEVAAALHECVLDHAASTEDLGDDLTLMVLSRAK
ncbi:MAG: SpoIIE family protein phosphatase [Thermoanaerobaculia bacterium]